MLIEQMESISVKNSLFLLKNNQIMANPFPNIIADPAILGGKPCVARTRISVELIMEWLGTGGTIEAIAQKHPAFNDRTGHGSHQVCSTVRPKRNRN